MKIAIIGTGYVGLVSGVCLAAVGHEVTCIDLRPEVVDQLNAGRPHIYERGLEEMLRQVIGAKRFRATLDFKNGMVDTEVVLISVGTPSIDGRIYLGYFEAAVRQVGEWIKTSSSFVSVVVKSTVTPGTADTVMLRGLEASSGKKFGAFGVGMNPEFLREGNAIEDFMNPDRIVLGHEDAETLARLEKLYAPWKCDKVRVNTRTAELIKYANNCILATQISLANEIANLSGALGGIDIMEVMRGVHLDKRWSPILEDGSRVEPAILTYLEPGCGFGGSCFPKDVQALRSLGIGMGLPMSLLNAVLSINEAQPNQIVIGLKNEIGRIAGANALVLGLAFKPYTDDIRESASQKIIADLLSAGASVSAHDPIALSNARQEWVTFSGVNYVEKWEEHVDAADIIVVATKWQEYAKLPACLRPAPNRRKTIVDARRFFKPSDFPCCTYLAVGLSPRRELLSHG